ncbi:ABC transporter ATP-binding protein [Infirmifilum lucidum]|uniref:ABC transporter ATP-binding protein n=1 Tax=Infirmifilum lucidum TaxID=2776706 RepID=A0A7L9FH37_9CREN|nr:ABC transporter ATP-binding protein [Infirmifilum lucidum]QOJ79148.1 ABC transporter ATP-binding protein [Infirmifilum lucidum]
MVRVRLENVSKTFKGGVDAVKNLNLEVKDKEFVVLLGPSGCGKTTTLLMIAGVYKPNSGYIYFDDTIVNDLEPKDRNIGMVFQSYALYPHMTVYENIAFPLRLKKLPKQEIDARVREVSSMLKIEDLLNRKPSQLSGGQQQRVALARAIVKQPQLFLMDEPLSNLDAKIRVEVRAELKRLQRELGITTIYVTHDQAEAMSLADRIAVMNRGELQQYATPEELYNNPANTFVASFIGSPPANLLDAEVVLEPHPRVEVAGASFALPEDLAGVFKERGETRVTIMLRPEHIKVKRGKGFTVYSTEWLGREEYAFLRAPDGSLVRAVLSPEERFDVGEEVEIAFDFRKVHFYKRSGELIV